MKRRILILLFGAIILWACSLAHNHKKYAPDTHRYQQTTQSVSAEIMPLAGKADKASAEYLLVETGGLCFAKSHSQHHKIFISSLSFCKSVMTHMIFRVFRN